MTQVVSAYTGEGAYHGSTKPKPQTVLNPWGVLETEPTTIAKYRGVKPERFETFTAQLSTVYEEVVQMGIPSQEEIEHDGSTFVWTPFYEALRTSGPLTQSVLLSMEPHLLWAKKFCYVDSKIQYFESGDVAVDSQHYHVDGTIVVRGEFAEKLGHPLLHDMRARILGDAKPPQYLAYQSSIHCPTQFVVEPLTLEIPDFIPDFDGFDALVRAAQSVVKAQPPGSIVHFDGLTVHSAVPATSSGWRLWIRVIETDKEVAVTPEVTDCYRSVYRS